MGAASFANGFLQPPGIIAASRLLVPEVSEYQTACKATTEANPTVERRLAMNRSLGSSRDFPRQGTWSEEEYLKLDTNRLIELSDGHLEVLTMPTTSHQMIVAYLYG